MPAADSRLVSWGSQERDDLRRAVVDVGGGELEHPTSDRSELVAALRVPGALGVQGMTTATSDLDDHAPRIEEERTDADDG